MWPWEHLALGYVLYALGRRLRRGEPPSDAAAVALAVGTQFPDLVDKPLAWGLGLLPSGLSLGHSVFVAVPASVAGGLLADRFGARAVGVAFGVGYLSHLLGDVLFYLLTGGDLVVGFLLWPLVPTHPDAGGLLPTIERLWTSFRAFLATPRGRLYLALDVVFLGVAAGLWLLDGAPGLRWPGRAR